MDTEHILTLLISERDKLNQAIQALGGLTKQRGRPRRAVAPAPKAAVAAQVAPAAPAKPARKKRKPMSAAQKKAHSARMTAFWAAKRKAAKE
jgi:hypothetical protein